jgi:hypothetical protein
VQKWLAQLFAFKINALTERCAGVLVLWGTPDEARSQHMGFYTSFEPPESAKARRRPATSAKAASERRHIRGLAAQRQQIPGVRRLLHALAQIEDARAECRAAFVGLRVTLTIMPLAKAFAEFQREGGVTAADWQDWLDGLPLQHQAQRGKGHLRLVVNQEPALSVDDEPEYDEDYEERDYDDEEEG